MKGAFIFGVTVLLSCPCLAHDLIWSQTTAPVAQWQFVTSSSDGTKLMAAVYGVTNEIYTSRDSGANWVRQNAPTLIHSQWSCGASSADGSVLVAGVGDGVSGGLYMSTDSGVSWEKTTAPKKNWWSVAVSADGTKLLAGSGSSLFGSGIYVSTDGGETWVAASAPTNGTYCVASSADGVKCFAGDVTGGIYASTNSGISWFQTSAPSRKQWYSIASSSDGTKLVASVFGGGIFVSANSGLTWAQTAAPIANWFRVACSSDGTRLAALSDSGIYTSTDSGLTWIQSTRPEIDGWWSLASSSDGTSWVAAVSMGGIYRGLDSSTGTPPNITTGPQIVKVSSSDLSSSNGARLAEAINARGIHRDAASHVGTPPSITRGPQSLSVTAGFPASFAVSVIGTPPFTYHWKFNNTEIGSATTASFTLANAFPKDAGAYSVAVSNLYGNVTSVPAVLTVLPFSLSEARLVDGGGFQFNLDSATNVSYSIEHSATLRDWMPLTTFRGVGGRITIIDPAMVETQRFYRVVLLP
jgi:Immunoglobulin I-set domain/BNR/Asp-box repeat